MRFKNYFYSRGNSSATVNTVHPVLPGFSMALQIDHYLVRLYTSKLTTDCLDVCEQGFAGEFEAGYCLRSGERTGVVDATSPSPR